MGAEAYRELADYRAEADKCAAAFVAAGAESPLPYLMNEGDFSQIQTQAAQFTHASALAQVWKSYGVMPDITVGHSLGEVAAAYIAGAITLADAAAVVIARARVVDGLPGRSISIRARPAATNPVAKATPNPTTLSNVL